METQKFSEYAWSIGASKNVLRLGTDDSGGRAMEDAARVWKTLDGDGTSLRERREPHHHGGADRPERPMAGDLRTQGRGCLSSYYLRTQGRGCLFAPPTHARGGVPWGGAARGAPPPGLPPAAPRQRLLPPAGPSQAGACHARALPRRGRLRAHVPARSHMLSVEAYTECTERCPRTVLHACSKASLYWETSHVAVSWSV